MKEDESRLGSVACRLAFSVCQYVHGGPGGGCGSFHSPRTYVIVRLVIYILCCTVSVVHSIRRLHHAMDYVLSGRWTGNARAALTYMYGHDVIPRIPSALWLSR